VGEPVNQTWLEDATGWRGDAESWMDIVFPERNVTPLEVQYVIGPEFEMYHRTWLEEAGIDG
jgi:hypothetical protein